MAAASERLQKKIKSVEPDGRSSRQTMQDLGSKGPTQQMEGSTMFIRSIIFASVALGFAFAANSASAGNLYDAFCKGSTPTPQYICDQIKAAEKPILNPQVQKLKVNQVPRRTTTKKIQLR